MQGMRRADKRVREYGSYIYHTDRVARMPLLHWIHNISQTVVRPNYPQYYPMGGWAW